MTYTNLKIPCIWCADALMLTGFDVVLSPLAAEVRGGHAATEEKFYISDKILTPHTVASVYIS